MPEVICGQLILSPPAGASQECKDCYEQAKLQLISDCANCNGNPNCEAIARTTYLDAIGECPCGGSLAARETVSAQRAELERFKSGVEPRRQDSPA